MAPPAGVLRTIFYALKVAYIPDATNPSVSDTLIKRYTEVTYLSQLLPSAFIYPVCLSCKASSGSGDRVYVVASGLRVCRG